MDEVLHPREVCVTHRRNAVLPALTRAQPLTAPIAVVEGRVGKDEVSLETRMQVLVEAVCPLRSQICLDTPNGKVHFREPPSGRVRLLAEDGHVVSLAIMGFD